MRICLRTKILWVVFAAFGIASCNSEGGKNDNDNFDRAALLDHYAKNIIIPAYNALAEKTLALQRAANTFSSSNTEANLQTLRNAWKEAALSWQNANHFNFGPAGEEGLRKGLIEEIGTFPVAVSKIESSVGTGQWNTSDFNRDARGILAIEYLLYGENHSIAQVIAAFASNPKRGEFLLALTEDVHKRVSTVQNAWPAYQVEFVKGSIMIPSC